MPEFEFNRFCEQAKAELLQSGDDFLPSMHLFTESRKVDLVPHRGFFAKILPEIIKQEKVLEFIFVTLRVIGGWLFVKSTEFETKGKKVVHWREKDFKYSSPRKYPSYSQMHRRF